MDFELTGLYMKNALTGTLVAYLYVLADPERGSPSMIRKTSDVETQIYREKEKRKKKKNMLITSPKGCHWIATLQFFHRLNLQLTK